MDSTLRSTGSEPARCVRYGDTEYSHGADSCEYAYVDCGKERLTACLPWIEGAVQLGDCQFGEPHKGRFREWHEIGGQPGMLLLILQSCRLCSMSASNVYDSALPHAGQSARPVWRADTIPLQAERCRAAQMCPTLFARRVHERETSVCSG